LNKALLTLLATLSAGLLAGVLVIYAGVVDVAADSPHSAFVYRIIATAREHAVAHRIHGIAVPPGLDDSARGRRGAGNYAAMCVGCHLRPGMEDSEIRAGLYPQPPNLTRTNAHEEDPGREAAHRFWIIKHGIKASAMAAWSKSGMRDDDIWDLVAFLRLLPTLSTAQYHDLVASSPGHSHAGHDADHELLEHEAGHHHEYADVDHHADDEHGY
jgi:mono/diheme cytochrome c family protein